MGTLLDGVMVVTAIAASVVMIDSYALINRMGSGEAWTDLCNECLQKIDNAWGRMTENQKVFLGAGAPFSVKACGPYDGMLA
uniref:Uncharacterized protein n=1 Tax=Serratia proteamaculans (strain 568) TaxID=399741 RepID=A8G8I4_SERP5